MPKQQAVKHHHVRAMLNLELLAVRGIKKKFNSFGTVSSLHAFRILMRLGVILIWNSACWKARVNALD